MIRMGMIFEYYVLNYNHDVRRVEMFNIFDNISLSEAVEKEVRKYIRSPKNYSCYNFGATREDDKKVYGFHGLCHEIKSLIRWQEWCRREYEISVGDAFEDDINKLEKWDCYQQCEPNIEIIAYTVIRQYKEQIKNKNNG